MVMLAAARRSIPSFARCGLPSPAVVRDFVGHSNRIEGEPDEPGVAAFDDHLRVALAIAGGARLTPRAIHKRLMRGWPEIYPGEYRQLRVRVGGAEKVPPMLVRPLMAELLRLAQAAPRLGGAGLLDLHFRYEAIHPFCDGNGRSGRLWLNQLRLAAGLPWLTVLSQAREEYFAAIRAWEEEQAGRRPSVATDDVRALAYVARLSSVLAPRSG